MTNCNEDFLSLCDSVQRTYEIFRMSSCYSLPVIADSGLFAGVARLRDLLGADERETIEAYISQE